MHPEMASRQLLESLLVYAGRAPAWERSSIDQDPSRGATDRISIQEQTSASGGNEELASLKPQRRVHPLGSREVPTRQEHHGGIEEIKLSRGYLWHPGEWTWPRRWLRLLNLALLMLITRLGPWKHRRQTILSARSK